MKKLLHALARRFRQPKWRHGKLSALLMAGFLAVCVLVNIGVKALEDTYGWRSDLSFNAYATTGEETQAALNRLENDVELYLLYQNGDEDASLLQLLTRYAVLSSRIRVMETDISQNPGILTRFAGTVDKTPQSGSVIVNCPAAGRYELLDYSDFLVQGYNIDTGSFQIEGLAYEKKLTEAILRVSQEQLPTVGLLQGHGELSPDSLSLLTEFLSANSYASATVNLLTGDTLEGVDLLMIFSPQKDFTEAELEAINAFAQGGGSLFLTRDYTDPIDSMPNYMALLRSYGIVPLPGVVVAGEEDAGTYYQNQLSLLPYMQQTDMTLSLISSGMDLVLMPAACAFETPDPDQQEQSLSTGAILKTGPHAYVRDLTDGNTSIDQQPGDIEGELSVALYATRVHANGNISRVFAAGCSATFIAEYIYQQTYVQQFLLQLLGQLLPDKAVSLDIMASPAIRPQLTVGSQTIGVVLVVAVPLLVLLAGVCVLLPRRNR